MTNPEDKLNGALNGLEDGLLSLSVGHSYRDLSKLGRHNLNISGAVLQGRMLDLTREFRESEYKHSSFSAP